MKILRQLIGLTIIDKPEQLVQKTFRKLQLTNDTRLPDFYHEYLMEVSRQKFKPRLLFNSIINKIPDINNIPGLVKIFTIIFNLLHKTNYPSYYLEKLECLNQLQNPSKQLLNKHCWLKQLSGSCMTYLGRLASLGDIYERALTFRTAMIGVDTMLTDLYRLVNVYGMLVQMLNQATNSVGRYFREEYEYYIDFYQVMRTQLLMGYYYMRYICNYFMTAFSSISVDSLVFFNDIIPEVELLCDQLEQFFMNKYYKQGELGRRLYFKEEQIQQLRYHIRKSREESQIIMKQKQVEEMLKTNDSEGFGFKKDKVLATFT